MEEKIVNELYEYYLNKKLDAIFNPNEVGCVVSPIVEDFGYESEFRYGYQRVKNSLEMVNYWNFRGELLCDEWYDDGLDFYYGYAVVRKYFKEYGGIKENVIDTTGKPISDEWFDEVVFDNKNIRGINYKDRDVERYYRDEYRYYDSNNRGFEDYSIPEDVIKSSKIILSNYRPVFEPNYKKLEIGGKYNYRKIDRTFLLDEPVDYLGDFVNGYALVQNNGKWNLIDINGNYVSKNEWFDEIKRYDDYVYYDTEPRLLTDGICRVFKDKMFNYMDKNGNLLTEWTETTKSLKSTSHCAKYDLLRYRDLKDFKEINRTMFTTEISNGKVTYKLNAIPIRVYDEYVLCARVLNKGSSEPTFGYFLFDRETHKYRPLGKSEQRKKGDTLFAKQYNCLSFDDNFIHDYYNKKVFLIYGKQVRDITDYYVKNLRYKKNVSVNKNEEKILSKTEFHFERIEDINELLREEAALRRQNDAKKEQKQEYERINSRIKEMQQDELGRKEAISELVSDIESDFERLEVRFGLLEELEQDGAVPRINCNTSYLFKEAKDEEGNRYLEFRSLVTKISGKTNRSRLHLFNLSREKFINVKMSNRDYRGCNLDSMEPTKVYKRDCSNCIFDGVHFDPLISWEGVNICGSTFSDDKDYKTPNIMPAFEHAIYDDTTLYNGKPLTQLIKKKKEEEKPVEETPVVEVEAPKTAHV